VCETAADIIGAILDKDPPDLPVAERHVPPALERLVDRCLEKSPSARFQSAGDLAFALEGLSSHSESSAAVGAVPLPHATKRARLAWILVAILAVAFVGSLVLGAMDSFRRTSGDPRIYRASILLPENVTPHLTPAYRLALSPDGTRLAFAGTGQDGQGGRLWVRSLDALTAHPLAGTEGAVAPFWSPDSRYIGFFAGGKVKKIDAAGGPPLILCDTSTPFTGATWNRDDVILFTTTMGPILRVSAAGGVPSIVTKPDTEKGETQFWWPSLSTGRKAFSLPRDRWTASQTSWDLCRLARTERPDAVGARRVQRQVCPGILDVPARQDVDGSGIRRRAAGTERRSGPDRRGSGRWWRSWGRPGRSPCRIRAFLRIKSVVEASESPCSPLRSRRRASSCECRDAARVAPLGWDQATPTTAACHLRNDVSPYVSRRPVPGPPGRAWEERLRHGLCC
jgi:WD40 repeat protein